MSEENHNSHTAIIVGGMTALATLGAGLFANWDKVFVSTPSSQVAPTVVEQQDVNAGRIADDPNATAPQESTKALDLAFAKSWSSEQQEEENYLLQINLSVASDQLSGTVESLSQEKSSKKESRKKGSDKEAIEAESVVFALKGEGEGNVAVVQITDSQGDDLGQAELTLDGDVLTWRLVEAQALAEEALPSLVELN